jgi:hypothetical protein
MTPSLFDTIGVPFPDGGEVCTDQKDYAGDQNNQPNAVPIDFDPWHFKKRQNIANSGEPHSSCDEAQDGNYERRCGS